MAYGVEVAPAFTRMVGNCSPATSLNCTARAACPLRSTFCSPSLRLNSQGPLSTWEVFDSCKRVSCATEIGPEDLGKSREGEGVPEEFKLSSEWCLWVAPGNSQLPIAARAA